MTGRINSHGYVLGNEFLILPVQIQYKYAVTDIFGVLKLLTYEQKKKYEMDATFNAIHSVINGVY